MSDAFDFDEFNSRYDALSDFFEKHGYGTRGFTGELRDSRTLWWGKTVNPKGEKPVFEVSVTDLMTKHPLELLDLADEALTRGGRAH